MKNRRFWAALLCVAMIFTSQSFNVSAAMQDSLTEADNAVIGTELAEDSDQQIVEEAPVDELTVEDQVDEGILEEISPVNDEVLTDDDVISADIEPEGSVTFDMDVIEQPEGVVPPVLGVSANGTLTISGNQKLSEYDYEEITIPSGVKFIPKDEKLFYNNSKVTQITFAGGDPLIIEEGAFEGATSLSEFHASVGYSSVSANTFRDCTSLRKFDFCNVTSISENAFAGCTNFNTILRGQNIGYIGENAFRSTGFTELDFTEDNKFTANVARLIIGKGAFSNCTKLTKVTLPASLEKIPEECFDGCSKLSELAANGGKAVVEKYAFRNCTSLLNITTDFKVKEIQGFAFSACSKLQSVKFAVTVKKTGARVFESCGENITVVEFHYHNEDDYADDSLVIDPDTFPSPIPARATIRGYDGVVKDYAAKAGFKKYETLIPARSIKVKTKAKPEAQDEFGDKMTVTVASSAKPGTEVTITIQPKDGDDPWLLRRDSLIGRDAATNSTLIKKFTFSGEDNNKLTFKFEMSSKNVVIDGGVYKSSALKNKFSHTIGAFDDKGGEDFVYSKTEKRYNVLGAGYKGRIYIDNGEEFGASANIKIGQWMFDYSSSNEKAVTVDKNGVVMSKGEGDAVITAKYKKGNYTVKIPIHVGGSTSKIKEIRLDVDKITAPVLRVERVTRTLDGVSVNDVPKVILDASYINLSAQKVNLVLTAIKEDGGTIYVDAGWTIADTNIATLKTKSGSNNANVLNVKKGANGETYVRAAYNTGEKKNGKDVYKYGYLIVVIEDITPRPTRGATITVNTQMDDDGSVSGFKGGTLIQIIPYDGYEIDHGYIPQVYQKNGVGVIPCDLLEVTDEGNGDFRLIKSRTASNAGLEAGQKKVFSGKTQLFIRVQYNKRNGTDLPEKITKDVPLDRVQIVNSPVPLKATMSGKINLLYNNRCYAPVDNTLNPQIPGCFDELPLKAREDYVNYTGRYINATIGEVKVTNNIDADKAMLNRAGIASPVELWDISKYEYWRTHDFSTAGYSAAPADNKLSNNFTVDVDYDFKNRNRQTQISQNLIIRRTANGLLTEMKNDKETDVTYGYLALYFAGYGKPVLQKITIPTKSAAPAYVLSQTATKENQTNRDGLFKFKIVDKKTKKITMVSQNSLAPNGIRIDQDASSHGAFTNVVMDGEEIKLSSQGSFTEKLTAVIKVKRQNWEKEATYKYTVTFVENTVKPKAKLSSGTVKINRNYVGTAIGAEAEVILTLDQPNCILTLKNDYSGTGKPFKYIGKSSLETDALNKMAIVQVHDPDSAKITLKVIVTDNTITPGTYKWEFQPEYTWKDGTLPYDGQQLKKMAFNVNVLGKAPVIKLAKSAYTFNMLYPGLEEHVVKIKLTNLPTGVTAEKAQIDVSGATFTYKSGKDTYNIANKIASMNSVAHEYDPVKKIHYIKFRQDARTLTPTTYNFVYMLSGIKVNGAVIEPIKVTLKGISKSAQVTLSQKSQLNAVDYTSCAEYATKFKYLTNPDVTRLQVEDNTSVNRISTVLRAEWDADKKITKVYALHPDANPEFANKQHPLVIRFFIGNDSARYPFKSFKIKPVQRMPKLLLWWNSKMKKAVFHAGVRDDRRKQDFVIIKATQLKDHITKVKISDTNNFALRNAFKVTYDNWDGNDPRYPGWDDHTKKVIAGAVEIECIAPELLVSGKNYELTLVTEYVGQFYKRDNNGNIVYEKNADGTDKIDPTTGKKIPVKIGGATIKIPVVVYK